MLCCPQSDLKWIEVEESDGSDVKMVMLDVEKLEFCLVLFRFKFCSYCQESLKENSNFSVFEIIRVTVSLDCTFTHMLKLVCLQVHADKKGKL